MTFSVEHWDAWYDSLRFGIQWEDIIEHTNGKCRVFTNTPHNTIEHTHSKILISTLERQVSWGDINDEVVDQMPQNRVKWPYCAYGGIYFKWHIIFMVFHVMCTIGEWSKLDA